MALTSMKVKTIEHEHHHLNQYPSIDSPVYIPRNATVFAIQYIVNAGSLNALKLKRPPGTFLGGNLRARTILEIPSMKIRIKPIMRIVHGKLEVNENSSDSCLNDNNVPHDSDEIPCGNRKDGSSQGRTSCREAQGNSTPLFEPMADHAESWPEADTAC